MSLWGRWCLKKRSQPSNSLVRSNWNFITSQINCNYQNSFLRIEAAYKNLWAKSKTPLPKTWPKSSRSYRSATQLPLSGQVSMNQTTSRLWTLTMATGRRVKLIWFKTAQATTHTQKQCVIPSSTRIATRRQAWSSWLLVRVIVSTDPPPSHVTLIARSKRLKRPQKRIV